jgi:hypothetical protein
MSNKIEAPAIIDHQSRFDPFRRLNGCSAIVLDGGFVRGSIGQISKEMLRNMERKEQ